MTFYLCWCVFHFIQQKEKTERSSIEPNFRYWHFQFHQPSRTHDCTRMALMEYHFLWESRYSSCLSPTQIGKKIKSCTCYGKWDGITQTHNEQTKWNKFSSCSGKVISFVAYTSTRHPLSTPEIKSMSTTNEPVSPASHPAEHERNKRAKKWIRKCRTVRSLFDGVTARVSAYARTTVTTKWHEKRNGTHVHDMIRSNI